MRRLPPSVEYLFDRSDLESLMQSLVGANMWLNQPIYLKEKKDFKVKRRSLEARMPTSFRFHNKENSRKSALMKGRTDHKGFKNNTKNNSFRTREKKWLSKSSIQRRLFAKFSTDMVSVRSKQIYHENYWEFEYHSKPPLNYPTADVIRRYSTRRSWNLINRADQRFKKATNTETSRSKLHIEGIRNSKERRATPNFRSSWVERFRKNKTLPVNFPGNSARFPPETGLDGKDRSISSLSSRLRNRIVVT